MSPVTDLVAAIANRFGPAAVITDPDMIAPWLTDWRGRYHGAAAAVLAPADTAQVAAMMAMASAARVPIVPQGGNTSMVGGATPPADGSALILSLRRLNHIRSIVPGHVVAEAGVVLQTLHDAVGDAGQRFPLTLGARGSATIGGLVSTNAGGTQVLRHGTMRTLTHGIEAVLPDGSVVDGLNPLKKDNRGYDLRALLSGAEGTLGIVTAATLSLVPAITARAVGWAGLDSPAAAYELLNRIDGADAASVESFEIIPGDSFALAVAHVAGARAPLEGQHRWHVLIEAVTEGDAPDVPRLALERLLGRALEEGRIGDAVIAASEAQAQAFWTLRDSLSAAEKATGPAVQHDISVPVATMPTFMVEAAATVEAWFAGTHATAFGHLGDGNVHFHVRAPAGVDPTGWYAGDAHTITAFVHDLVVGAGGSISAEHGIGQMKRAELARLDPPARLAALRAIKGALDPYGLMNPGKLL